MKTNLSFIKLISFSAVCLVVFSTCKKDQKLAPVIEKNPTKDYMEYNNEGLVGSGGGKITLGNSNTLNGVSVTIPAGSLSSSIKIKMQVDNSIQPTGDTSFEILKLEPEGLTFSSPVTLKIPVSKTISNPVLFYFVPDSMVLQQVPILEINRTDGFIRAEINHFSKYFIKENISLFFDASLYNTGISIKAIVKFGGKNGLASVPVNKLNYILSLGTCKSARQFIDNAIPVTNLGTIQVPEQCYGTMNVELRQGNWLFSTSIKSIKVAVQRKGTDPTNSSWVKVSMVNPINQLLFTSGILDPDKREDFFSGKALVFNFDTPAESGKNYFLQLSWCLSSTPAGYWLLGGRFTDVFEVNTYQDYPPWTTSNMINSDPDKNKNFVDDQNDVVPTQLPTLTTTSATAITTTTATSGGNVTSDGGAAVTARGVCWSTSSNPTTLNSKTTDGTGATIFSSSITGLTPNTTYYIRAYATNNVGTAYGNNLSFTTNPIQVQIPTITTTSATSITTTTATSGGNISSEGGAAITAKGVCWSTSANPTTSNSKTNDGTGTGIFTSTITGLTANTTYYVRAYATNTAGTGYGTEVSFKTSTNNIGGIIFNPNLNYGNVSDIDNNVYKTITIGTQVWMAENLKTTKYNDGTAIPLVTDNTAWGNLSTPGYCWYNNDAATNKNTYGALYNWFTVNTGKLCPTGWHVPTDAEWTILTTYLGGEGAAGGKLKETGTSHWSYPNTAATNTSGFTALPGGGRSNSGAFSSDGGSGSWWSSSEYSTSFPWYRSMSFYYSEVTRYYNLSGKKCGNSVRCLRDY